MNRRLCLTTSLGVTGWLAAARYGFAFGQSVRGITKFRVTLPGLGPDGANNVGNYLRRFTVSADINVEHIKARMNNGVLEIELPKSERAKPRRIVISTN